MSAADELWKAFGEKFRREMADGKVIFTCKQCGVKIRVPRNRGMLEVRCPKCGAVSRFDSGKKVEDGNRITFQSDKKICYADGSIYENTSRPEDRRTIIIRRDADFFGSASRYNVSLDNQFVGKIATGKEITMEIDAGEHLLTAEYFSNPFNVKIPSGLDSYEFRVYVKAGPFKNRIYLEQTAGKLLALQNENNAGREANEADEYKPGGRLRMEVPIPGESNDPRAYMRAESACHAAQFIRMVFEGEIASLKEALEEYHASINYVTLKFTAQEIIIDIVYLHGPESDTRVTAHFPYDVPEDGSIPGPITCASWEWELLRRTAFSNLADIMPYAVIHQGRIMDH